MIRCAVTLHIVLALRFVVRCISIVLASLSGPSHIQVFPITSSSILSSAFSLQVLLLSVLIFIPLVLPGSGDMDPLALSSPLLLQIGEEPLMFSIFALLAVVDSLPALVVWPAVIHEAEAGREEGKPVLAHSFRSVSPSAAFPRT